MVSGSKLGLASSEEGWESTKVSGESALWPPGGFGGKRSPHKMLGKPWFSEGKRNQCRSRRLIQMRTRRLGQATTKPAALQRGPKTGEEKAKLGTVAWSVEEQRGLQSGACGEGAVDGRGR